MEITSLDSQTVFMRTQAATTWVKLEPVRSSENSGKKVTLGTQASYSYIVN